jgi:hypothetical protein
VAIPDVARPPRNPRPLCRHLKIRRWPWATALGAASWAAETDKLLDRMAGRFARVETRRGAGAFVRALLADLPRKNCWSVAEHAGGRDPYGMQHFLSRASWDTDGVREDLRDYVIGALAHTDTVLAVDETGNLAPAQLSGTGTERLQVRVVRYTPPGLVTTLRSARPRDLPQEPFPDLRRILRRRRARP